MLDEINGSKNAEELAQAVFQARTGRRVEAYELAALPDLWLRMPRSKPVSGSHRKICLSQINGFLGHCGEHLPSITKLDHLTMDHAQEFMDWHEGRGVSPRTWNAIMATLRAACRRGNCRAFDDLRQKSSDTVHRIPYTPDELKDIFDEAKKDDLLYPLVVTAACTAMRRGDCCNLEWAAVDLDEGFIKIKTSKTGRVAEIPMPDLLRGVTEGKKGNGSKYVFPDLARQYEVNAGMLTKRLRKILASVGFHDGDAVLRPRLEDYQPEELKRKALACIGQIQHVNKREKALAMFKAYAGGKTLCQSAAEVGISKATASAYLNQIEKSTGICFIRGKRRAGGKMVPKRGDVHVERENGLLRASVRDFHSFRTTWITLALCSGIPFELVKTVTGHATADIVMENYFRPQREHLKDALEKSMPSLLTSGNYNPVDRLPDLLRSMTADNWEQVRDAVLRVIGAGV